MTDAVGAATRKIIHVDMDAFYASVEQRDDPSLRGRPLAVGGSGERGVVAAASYEARRFGVRSAMPGAVARRQCPDLVFVPPRFEIYRQVSEQIRGIFLSYTPLVEPLSLDEAYLDVTENLVGIGSATRIAQEIRSRIRETTKLTASAGVSYNKFLAKLASDMDKPDGLFVISPEAGPRIVEDLEVGRFHGIGPATSERMRELGIRTGLDLRSKSEEFLVERFGKAGRYYHSICRGIDHRTVNPERERKSVGAEDTFERDLVDYDDMAGRMAPLFDKVWKACEKHGTRGRTVTLKVKYADFRQITRSHSSEDAVENRDELERTTLELLRGIMPPEKGVRLLGVSLSSFVGPDEAPKPKQLALF